MVLTHCVNSENIPGDMQLRRQWVCWKDEERDRKQTKVPYNPLTRQRADSSDPTTWVQFADAMFAYGRGGYDGVGYMLHEQGSEVFLDLDEAIDPTTGKPYPWAQAILDRFPSYAEISPSGTGIHLIISSSWVPEKGRRSGNIECYPHHRFLTVTGNVLPGHKTIQRVAGFSAWHRETFPEKSAKQVVASAKTALTLDDQELLDKAINARNGRKFLDLFNGVLDYHDGDDSRADAAFLSCCAFWTQDRAQLDRLLRQSALYRAKWDREDYAERTIDFVLGRQRDVYTPKPELSCSTCTVDTEPSDLPPDGPEHWQAWKDFALAQQGRANQCGNALAISEGKVAAAEAECARLRDLRVQAAAIRRAPGLKGSGKAVAETLLYSISDAQADGIAPTEMRKLPIAEISRKAGCSPDVASTWVNRFVDAGAFLKEKVPGPDRETEWVDVDTGEVIRGTTKGYECTHLAATCGVDDLVKGFVAFTPTKKDGEAIQWGGEKEPRPTCPEHPDAPVVQEIRTLCSACRTEIAPRREVEWTDETMPQVAALPRTPTWEKEPYRNLPGGSPPPNSIGMQWLRGMAPPPIDRLTDISIGGRP